jgi:phosphate uptake regulator
MSRPDNSQTAKRKLNLVGKKTFAISLPIDLVRQLSLKKGESLVVRRIGEKIIIERDKH